jgi:hypothetical protein
MLEPYLANEDPSGEALLQVVTDGLNNINAHAFNNPFPNKTDK